MSADTEGAGGPLTVEAVRGRLVRPGPFEPAKPTRRWVRCEPCRLAGPQVIALIYPR